MKGEISVSPTPSLLWGSSYMALKESICQSRRVKRHGFIPWVGKISWRRAWQPTPVFWRIPWTEELGELQSMGSQRITSDWRSWHSHSTVCSLTFYPMNIVKCSFLYTPGLVCFVMQYLVTVRHTQHKSTKWSSRSVHLFQLWSMICHFSYIHHLEN